MTIRLCAGKTLTPKLMVQVEEAFITRFGPYAGWAHNVLFISDLSSSKQYLPEKLRPDSGSERGKRKTVNVKQEPEVDAELQKDVIKGLLCLCCMLQSKYIMQGH